MSLLEVDSEGRIYYEDSATLDARRYNELYKGSAVWRNVSGDSGSESQTNAIFDVRFDAVKTAEFGIYLTLFVLFLLVVRYL